MAITTITNSMVSVNAIQGTLIADNAITAVHIASNAVASIQIAENNVTAREIAANTITVAQLADDAVEADKIADGVITTNHLNKAMISSQTEVAVATGDFILLGDTSDSNNLKKAPISSILAGTLTTAAQTNITSVGTLTGLTTSGNVGIGGAAADPQSFGTALHIEGGTNSVLYLRDTGNSNYGYLGFAGGSDNRTTLTSFGTGYLQFATNNTERMRIDASGEVGIGTTSPADKLHVALDSSTTNAEVDVVRIEATSSGTPAVGFGPFIDFKGDRINGGADSYGRLGFEADAMPSTTVDGAFVVQTAEDGTYSERLRIASDGKVGINKSDPSAYLDVHAPSGVSGPTVAYFKSDQHGLGVYINVESTYSEIRSNNNSYPLVLNANSGGNVGINHAAPARTLHVNSPNANIASFEGHQGEGLVISSGTNGRIDIIGYDDGASSYNNVVLRAQGSTDQLTLDTSGRVAIGTSTVAEILTVSSTGNSYWALKLDMGTSDYGLQTVGSGSYAIGILDAGVGYRGRWQHNGTLYTQDGNVHDIDSDERLKEEIIDCPSQWSLIKDLPLQRFKWKDRRNGDTFSYGWVAQPTNTKYPEFVEPIPQTKEDIDAGKEDPGYLTVKSGDIQKRSIAALQEAMARIEALEAEVAALKG